MKLVFLHGAPASGKLTVAKALVARVPARICDNHAGIDLALNVFDFGAPGFWELVYAARLAVVETAVQHNVGLLIMTSCYAEPEDRPVFEQYERIVQEAGGAVLPVFLSCSRDETVRRLGEADRRDRRKISSEEGFDKFMGQFVLTAVPRASCLHLDTTCLAPAEAARTIAEHFVL